MTLMMLPLDEGKRLSNGKLGPYLFIVEQLCNFPPYCNSLILLDRCTASYYSFDQLSSNLAMRVLMLNC